MPIKTTTKLGDTWDMISFRVYDDEGYIGLLIAANPDHRMTTIFAANIELNVPDIPSEEVNTTLPPWIKARG